MNYISADIDLNDIELLPEGLLPNYVVWGQDKKCTCGAHITYGENTPHHSDWCDLYVKV